MGGRRHIVMSWLVLLNVALAFHVFAGGSGLNTVVVVNQNSSNSCELGSYYCQQRQVPPQNVLPINWTGGNTQWSSNDLQTTLVTPLLNMLASEGLTNQIDYIVLSMDIPFQTSDGSAVDSTTSALFYGLRLGTGSDPLGITNSYAASEGVFGQAPIVGSPGYSFLTTMITGDSLAQAEQLVDQGVASDGTFPQPPVILAKSSDILRNIRYVFFNNTIFDVNVLGVSTILQTNTDSVWWPSPCLGYQTGLADFSVPDGLLGPGAIADSLTSFGGIIFGSTGQTNELAFIDAGAAGSYGTVAEPENDTQKFPNPEVYFYQSRGFSLAESYYQSVNVPYLGLMVAEPLAEPFARSGSGQWATNMANAVLSGTTNLTVKFRAHDGNHPLQQIDLFVDGIYYSTLTNLAPCPGNVLTVALNGYPVTYTVPTNATLSTVAAGLAAQINAATNYTWAQAAPYGDRIELKSTAITPSAAPFYVANTNSGGASGVSYSVNYLSASTPPQMGAGSLNKSGVYTMGVGFPSTLSYVIQASTNLMDWEPIFTNNVPGLLNFTDYASAIYPARYYRIAWPKADLPPQLSAPQAAGAGGFQMNVASVPGQAWGVQISTDLVHWVSVFTNQSGGASNYVDANAASSSDRFYRAFLANPPPPAFSVLNVTTNLNLIQVKSASLPYAIGVSNQGGWTGLETNFVTGEIQTMTASALGSGSSLSTFLSAAQPDFLASQALGMQGYTVISNVPSANAWIRFTFTLTNGQTVVVGVTNQSGGNSIALANQLYNAINTNSVLEGSDGVEAGDFVPLAAISVSFNLYAQSPGYQAAQIQVRPQWSGVVMAGSSGTLMGNLSDLQYRNHLYVTAGAANLASTFSLATTNLPDGYHQLTAVAYEGSDVRTETQATVPVQIQNTPLSATLTLLDLGNSSPVGGTYHIQVAANTNNVSLITLFSTGGALGIATNVSTATFTVAGTNLWGGLHPFYALVQTSSGLEYRTQTQWATLVDTP
jgi:uncharacterized protein (TIGR03790 family)